MKKPLKMRYWLLVGVVAYFVIAILAEAIFGTRSGPARAITNVAFVVLLLVFVIVFFAKIISYVRRRRSKTRPVQEEESEGV